MPIAFHPDQTFDVVLDIDKSLPEDQQSAFICRFLTLGEFQEAQRLYARAFNKDTPDDEVATIFEKILAVSIRGWKRMRDAHGNEIRFAPEKLKDVLSEGEYRELAKKAAEGSAIAEADRFLSRPPQQSPPGTGAATANKTASAIQKPSASTDTPPDANIATVSDATGATIPAA